MLQAKTIAAKKKIKCLIWHIKAYCANILFSYLLHMLSCKHEKEEEEEDENEEIRIKKKV